MTNFYIEVPAHVQHTDQVSNQIQVKGGTNWDLSRSAVATPVSQLTDPPVVVVVVDPPPRERTASPYLPEHGLPPGEPRETVRFSLNSTLIPATGQKLLKRLTAAGGFIVVGHADIHEKNADKLSEKRAESIAKSLRGRGAHVSEVKSFGSSVPLMAHDSTARDNRRVDIFLAQQEK